MTYRSRYGTITVGDHINGVLDYDAAHEETREAAESYLRVVDAIDALESAVFSLTRVGTEPPDTLDRNYALAEALADG